jgi:hypothetical protein
MSMSGSMLTGFANRFEYGGPYGARRGVYWWNVATGRHGKIPVPQHDTYLASAPNGAVVADGSKVLLISATGKTRALGVPVSGGAYLRAVSDRHGVAVLGLRSDGTSHVAYRRFTASQHFHTLRFSTSKALFCSAVDTVAVACHTETQGGDLRQTVLVPTNGHHATAVNGGGYEFGLIGSTAIFPENHGLGSLRLGASTFATGRRKLAPDHFNKTMSGTDPYVDIRHFSPEVVGALGGVAVIQQREHRVMLVHSTRHGRPVLGTPKSPAAVSAFGLSRNRIAYAGDERTKGAGRYSAHLVTVTHSGGKVSFGSTRLLAAGSDYVLAGASKTVAVYATRDGQEHSDLKIVYRGKTHTISHVPFDSDLQVAGTRVMYAPDRAFTDGSTAIYDAATGTTKTVDTDSGCCTGADLGGGGTTPYLAGSTLYSMSSDGSVHGDDLTTDTVTSYSDPVAGTFSGVVYASAGHLAWTIVSGSGQDKVTSYVKDLSSNRSAKAIPGRVVGMSSAGILTTKGPIRPNDGIVGHPGAYSLRTYDGHVHTVLSNRTVFLPPQLVGKTIAWVDATGHLRVASVH